MEALRNSFLKILHKGVGFSAVRDEENKAQYKFFLLKSLNVVMSYHIFELLFLHIKVLFLTACLTLRSCACNLFMLH